MVTVSRRFLVCLAVLVPLSATIPVAAGVDIDFGARVDIGDDADLFLAISSRYFDRDRETVTHVGVRFTDPDDMAVSLFLCKRTGRDVAHISALRERGLSWWEIGARLGIGVDAWFVPVARDPGPPYGKAYGYWKKHRGGRPAAVGLSDAQVRDLVAVRVLHEYYGVSVEVAMQWRSSGKDLRTLVTREYRGRHHGGIPPGQHAKKHGKDSGKSRGKGGKK